MGLCLGVALLLLSRLQRPHAEHDASADHDQTAEVEADVVVVAVVLDEAEKDRSEQSRDALRELQVAEGEYQIGQSERLDDQTRLEHVVDAGGEAEHDRVDVDGAYARQKGQRTRGHAGHANARGEYEPVERAPLVRDEADDDLADEARQADERYAQRGRIVKLVELDVHGQEVVGRDDDEREQEVGDAHEHETTRAVDTLELDQNAWRYICHCWCWCWLFIFGRLVFRLRSIQAGRDEEVRADGGEEEAGVAPAVAADEALDERRDGEQAEAGAGHGYAGGERAPLLEVERDDQIGGYVEHGKADTRHEAHDHVERDEVVDQVADDEKARRDERGADERDRPAPDQLDEATDERRDEQWNGLDEGRYEEDERLRVAALEVGDEFAREYADRERDAVHNEVGKKRAEHYRALEPLDARQ